MDTKKCKVCGRELPLDQYRKTNLGLTHTCNECWKKNQAKGRLNKKAALNIEQQTAEARNLRLQDFTPRELLAELKRRGYKWQKMTVEQVIDYDKI